MKASIRAFLVDFGGTHTKWAVSDGSKLLQTGQLAAAPVKITEHGRATIDPDLFVSHVINLRTYLTERFGIPTDVAFTGQMASYSLVDSNGEFLSPIISWQDISVLSTYDSSKCLFDNSKARLDKPTYNLFDGFRPGLPLVNLPLVASDYSVVIKDSYFKTMLSVASDVWQFDNVLAKSNLHATDAAASGFYNPISGLWDYSLLEAQSIDQINLPNVIESFQPHPTVLQDAIRFWPAIGDQQAAIFGCEVKPNELFMHVATGAQVAEICNVEFAQSAILAGGKFQIRPYLEKGKVVSTVTHLPAGRLLERAMSFNQNELLTHEVLDEIDLENSEDAMIFKFMFDSKGSFSLENLTLSTFNSGNFVRALLVGIPNTLIRAANELPSEKYKNAVLSGGVLMRQRRLRDELKGLLLSLQFRDNFEEDTSIIGLQRLLQENLNFLEVMNEE